MIRQFLYAAAALAITSVGAAQAHDALDDKSKVTLVYDHVLPDVPGKSIKGVLVEYAPGAPRRHTRRVCSPCSSSIPARPR